MSITALNSHIQNDVGHHLHPHKSVKPSCHSDTSGCHQIVIFIQVVTDSYPWYAPGFKG